MTYSANAITPAQVKKIAEGAVPGYLWKYTSKTITDSPLTGNVFGMQNFLSISINFPAVEGNVFARIIKNYLTCSAAVEDTAGLEDCAILKTNVWCDADYMEPNRFWFPACNPIGADSSVYAENGALSSALAPDTAQGSRIISLAEHPILSVTADTSIDFELPVEFFPIGNLEIPNDPFVLSFVMLLDRPLENDISAELTIEDPSWILAESKIPE